MNKAITKKEALAKVLGFDAYDVDEIDETGENRFEVGDGKEYLVLTEKEKDEELAENIKQSAWAFNAWFIADHSAKGVTEEIIKAIQPQCEDANDAILSLIEGGSGLAKFIDDAESADGAGHFLASYDGEEVEESGYFIYRVN